MAVSIANLCETTSAAIASERLEVVVHPQVVLKIRHLLEFSMTNSAEQYVVAPLCLWVDVLNTVKILFPAWYRFPVLVGILALGHQELLAPFLEAFLLGRPFLDLFGAFLFRRVLKILVRLWLRLF